MVDPISQIYTNAKFAFMKSFPLVCQTCQNVFYVYNSFYVNTRPIRHCSHACRHRQTKLNEEYFSDLTPDKYHTFGQIIACGFILDFKTVVVRSDQLTLEKIQTDLGSDSPIKNSELGKYQIRFLSTKMVNYLILLGLSNNRYFQEFPPYDILPGLLQTDCYKIVDGVQTFRTPSSKLALEVCYLVGGEIITETFKDVPKGVLGCYWVVIW